VAEKQPSSLTQPGLEPVPYVLIRRPDGTLALRHPDELTPAPARPEVK